MNKQPNQFGLDSLRLTRAERASMRASLLAHMEANPLSTPSPFWGIPSPFVALAKNGSPFSSRVMRPAAYAFALLLMVGGGTSLAAEGALPGDALYPVKVGVNESVRGALAFSTESKAAFAVELADRRLTEASTIAAGPVPDTTATSMMPAEFELAEPGVSAKIAADARVEVVAESDADREARSRVIRAAERAEAAIAALSATNPEAALAAEAKLMRALEAHDDTLVRMAASGDETAIRLLERLQTSQEDTPPTSREGEDDEQPTARPPAEEESDKEGIETVEVNVEPTEPDNATEPKAEETSATPPPLLPPLPVLEL